MAKIKKCYKVILQTDKRGLIFYKKLGFKKTSVLVYFIVFFGLAFLIVNILGGYGYKPALANMEKCILSAIEGKIV